MYVVIGLLTSGGCGT